MPHNDEQPIAQGPNWVTRRHPDHDEYTRVEEVNRASLVATREILVPFLVPHRFEGKQGTSPHSLTRSRLGYGIGLNQSYLSEILGHIRGAVTRYTWGPISPLDEGAITGAPQGDIALMMWQDVTRDGTTWTNLYLAKVLEWILSSPGGIVVVDTPSTAGRTLTEAEAKAAGRRPFQRFIPWSNVTDFKWGKAGFEWVKVQESDDLRTPMEVQGESERLYVLYELDDDGATLFSRWKQDGTRDGETVNLGNLVDRQGQPTLPIVRAIFGEHETIPVVGAGLLSDLADIIIDMFNVMSEMREGFRDSTFGIIAYRGNNANAVQTLLEDGTRFIHVGENAEDGLERLAGDASEVDAGLKLMDFSLKAWAWAARRQAADAMTKATGGPRSGTSIQAEFQLDLVPLLQQVTGTLDEIESSAMFIVGQLMGLASDSLKDVGVARDDEFQVEEESARIARIMAEFLSTGIPIPSELASLAGEAWAASLDFVDLDQEVVTVDAAGEEATVPLREVLRSRFTDGIEQEGEAARNLQAFGGLGTALPPFPEQ